MIIIKIILLNIYIQTNWSNLILLSYYKNDKMKELLY